MSSYCENVTCEHNLNSATSEISLSGIELCGGLFEVPITEITTKLSIEHLYFFLAQREVVETRAPKIVTLEQLRIVKILHFGATTKKM